MIVTAQEIQTFLQKASLTAQESQRIALLHGPVLRIVKNYLGYSVEQATYTHYLPRMLVRRQDVDRLYLPEVPVRSITSVYIDEQSRFSSDPFPASSLQESTTYSMDVDETGICKTGILFSSSYWPQTERSVKVTYVAGHTEAELAGQYADIKLGVLLAFQRAWNENAVQSQGGSAITAERLGDYSVSYSEQSTVNNLGMKISLPREAVSILHRHRRISL